MVSCSRAEQQDPEAAGQEDHLVVEAGFMLLMLKLTSPGFYQEKKTSSISAMGWASRSWQKTRMIIFF